MTEARRNFYGLPTLTNSNSPLKAIHGQPRGRAQVILHTTKAMQTAWRLYEQLGFWRSKDLDFMREALPVFGFPRPL